MVPVRKGADRFRVLNFFIPQDSQNPLALNQNSALLVIISKMTAGTIAQSQKLLLPGPIPEGTAGKLGNQIPLHGTLRSNEGQQSCLTHRWACHVSNMNNSFPHSPHKSYTLTTNIYDW